MAYGQEEGIDVGDVSNMERCPIAVSLSDFQDCILLEAPEGVKEKLFHEGYGTGVEPIVEALLLDAPAVCHQVPAQPLQARIARPQAGEQAQEEEVRGTDGARTSYISLTSPIILSLLCGAWKVGMG